MQVAYQDRQEILVVQEPPGARRHVRENVCVVDLGEIAPNFERKRLQRAHAFDVVFDGVISVATERRATTRRSKSDGSGRSVVVVVVFFFVAAPRMVHGGDAQRLGFGRVCMRTRIV